MKHIYVRFTGLLVITVILGCLACKVHAGNVEIPFQAANFTAPQGNAYLPMAKGLTYVYMAEEEEGWVVDKITQTEATKDILGVSTTVVHDAEWVNVEGVGMVLLEETYDWIAWDNDGNVWYFGEDSTAYEYDEDWSLEGTTKEGSWEAGVNDAQPGILMLANPRPGDSYRQEFAEEVAEDMGKVLNLGVTVILGEYLEGEEEVFEACLKTKEWTPLEPGGIEHKYYAPGVGLVLIEGHHGKKVITELVAIE